MFPRVRRLAVDHLHGRGGWLSPAYVEIDAAGTIARVERVQPEDWRGEDVLTRRGFAIPGAPNAHSHAFQRALVGRTEASTPGRADSFWSWRNEMYRLANTFSPEDLEIVAAQLYLEMLEAGMTSVAEFHYLHHDPSGAPYAEPAEMSLRLLEAARRVGLPITILPVLYQRGGFDKPAETVQARFLCDRAEDYLSLVARLSKERTSEVEVGIAPHSLRAVRPEALTEVTRAVAPPAPIHLHIAEQELEVEQCLVHLGKRPIEWLFDAQTVDARWCLVHATHAVSHELDRIARSKAVVALCPTTEANLGDGLFDAKTFLDLGGAIAIGSDSQASVDFAEELRLLEYGQRLLHRKRNVLAASDDPIARHVGRRLFDAAIAGGARAVLRGSGEIAPGMRADLVILGSDHPRLMGHDPSSVIDAWIFGAASGAIRDVIAGGLHVVTDGAHRLREGTTRAFRETITKLAL
jgi:formimidoylglutamate deiminase